MPQHPDDRPRFLAVPRPSPFASVVASALTGYLAIAAFLLDRGSTSPADHAIARLVRVLFGAAALVTLCLFLRLLDWSQAQPRETVSETRTRPGDRG